MLKEIWLICIASYLKFRPRYWFKSNTGKPPTTKMFVVCQHFDIHVENMFWWLTSIGILVPLPCPSHMFIEIRAGLIFLIILSSSERTLTIKSAEWKKTIFQDYFLFKIKMTNLDEFPVLFPTRRKNTQNPRFKQNPNNKKYETRHRNPSLPRPVTRSGNNPYTEKIPTYFIQWLLKKKPSKFKPAFSRLLSLTKANQIVSCSQGITITRLDK